MNRWQGGVRPYLRELAQELREQRDFIGGIGGA